MIVPHCVLYFHRDRSSRSIVQHNWIIVGGIWRFQRQDNLSAFAWHKCEPGLGCGIAVFRGNHGDTRDARKHDSCQCRVLRAQRQPHRE